MTSLPISNAETSFVSPVSKKERILFMDVVRGISLLGILLMNSMAMAQPFIFYFNMNLNHPITGPNYYAWLIEMVYTEGVFRGLFSILFGAGTILLLNRLEKTRGHLDAADIYYRRLIWLLPFGLINAFVFLWPGDILYCYAICGLFLFPFRNLSPKILIIAAFLLVALGTYQENSTLYAHKETITKGRMAESILSYHKKLTTEQNADLAAWQKYQDHYSSKAMMVYAKDSYELVHNSSYLKVFNTYAASSFIAETRDFYTTNWWDAMIFFFLGMALFKSGFLTGKFHNWFYFAIAILGIGIALYINFDHVKEMYADRFDQVKQSERSFANFYVIRRVLHTMGYLSLLILLYKVRFFQRILNLFAPVGQMAFTNYLSQSIIMSIIFIGFRWFGQLQRYQIYEVVAGIWIFQIIFSTVWLKVFAFGPFEWVWRSLTYLKRQPFLKTNEKEKITEVSPVLNEP